MLCNWCLFHQIPGSVSESSPHIWLLSSNLQDLIFQDMSSHCGVYDKWIYIYLWPKFLEPMLGRCVHSQYYPQKLGLFGDCGQVYFKFNKRTIPNELLQHRHVTSQLLELRLMCECTSRDLTDVWVHLSSYDWCMSAPLELWLMCECTARTMTKCVSAPFEIWLMCERTTWAGYDWCMS